MTVSEWGGGITADFGPESAIPEAVQTALFEALSFVGLLEDAAVVDALAAALLRLSRDCDLSLAGVPSYGCFLCRIFLFDDAAKTVSLAGVLIRDILAGFVLVVIMQWSAVNRSTFSTRVFCPAMA